MSLSQEMENVRVPMDSGLTATVFTADSTMGAIAAAFHITLPPATATGPERQGYLRSWQSAAQYVVSRLYDPSEVVDEDKVVGDFRDLEATFSKVASEVASAVSGGVFQTVFRLFKGAFGDPFEVVGNSVRSSLLYLYTSASAGVAFHSSELRGQWSESELSQDYLLRLGSFQAIAALARSGMLDPLAREKRATQGLGGLPIVVVVVIILAVAGLIGYVITSIHSTTARNTLIRQMQQRACEADPSRCSEVTEALASRLTQPPDDDKPFSEVVGKYVFWGVLAVGGIALLPRLTDALFAPPRRRREAE